MKPVTKNSVAIETHDCNISSYFLNVLVANQL